MLTHYRPAGEVKQDDGASLQRPGYFWLVYEWENLLFACIDCNQYAKRTRFPLANPATRACAPGDDLTLEEPLLIDPTAEDPAQFLRFREELLESIGGNARGTETIRVLGLNVRRGLLGERRRTLDNLRTLRALMEISPDSQKAEDAAALISRDSGPGGRYRAMMFAALGNVESGTSA